MSGCGNCESCGNAITYSRGEKGDSGNTGATGATGATGGKVEAIIPATTGTLDLLESQTGGRVIFDRAAGVVVTLPDSPTDGTNFTFQTKTDLTSNSYVIETGISGTDSYNGFITAKKAATLDEMFTTSGGLYATITFNGTTTGGDLGTEIHTVYSATESKWYVTGQYYGSGVLVTPFS